MSDNAHSPAVRTVADAAELRALLGPVAPRVRDKVRTSLTALDRDWLAASPFCLMATSADDGSCDVSPKGDPAGFVHVLDDTSIVVPERPGNRRADGFHNILSNGHVGLLFIIPGRGDTLRINGRAQLVSDAPWFDDLVVHGHRPQLAVLVDVDEVFFHCSKAFLRSHLWQPDSWAPDRLPDRPAIAKAMEHTGMTLQELEAYYGEAYAKKLYKS